MTAITIPEWPALEFRECECNGVKHLVLFEDGFSYVYGSAAYTLWDLSEQMEWYFGEGLLEEEDITFIRQAFRQLNLSNVLPDNLPDPTFVKTLNKCVFVRPFNKPQL